MHLNDRTPGAAVLQDVPLRLFLACLLLGIYLLIYINKPDSADGKAILAVASEMVRQGQPDMNPVGATDGLLSPLGQIGAVGQAGALYSKKAPVPSLLLAPFVLLVQLVPWLSLRATAMLFNPLVTVATALLLYTFARRLAYGPVTALALSLIFGLATMAIVYVKTLYGEPLVALLLLGAVMAAYRYRQRERPRDLLWVGTALALAVGVNTLYILYVPVLALYLWPERKKLAHLGSFILPLVLMGLCLAAYNWARFGSPLYTGYHFGAGEGFTSPLLKGLYGLSFSPYRGLFPYNPVLLLSIPGWLMFRRQSPRLAWGMLLLVAVEFLGFASWWSWYGGILWGPRFLLPVTPLIVLFLAPLLEAARTRLHLRWIIGAFVGLSLFVQLLGALYSYMPYIQFYEYKHLDELVHNPTLSAILGHMALLSVGWPLDPAWLSGGLDPVHLAASLGLILAGFGVLWRRLKTRWALSAIALCALVSLNVVVARQPLDPRVGALDKILQPPGTLLAASTLFDDALLDLKNTSRVIAMNAPTRSDDDHARQVWEYALRQGQFFWFVTWFGAADPQNWQEQQLWQTAAFVREQALPDNRALLFNLAAVPQPDLKSGWSFDGKIMLDAWGYRRTPEGVAVTVRWSARTPLDRNYTWFIHLLDASGTIRAQQDRQPQGGYAPTSTWTRGTPVQDRLFFPLPWGTDTAAWQIRVGLVDPTTGQPAPAADSADQPQPDPFVVLKLP